MEREEVVSRKITRLMRDDVVIEHGKPVEGISFGIYRFFNVYLELDGRDLMKAGMDRRYDPLKFVPDDVRERLTELPPEEGAPWCIGEVITDVVTSYNQVKFRLSSGRYFWVEDAIFGTEVCLAQPEDVAEEALLDYWAPPGPESKL